MSKLKVALQIGAIDDTIKADPEGTLKYLKDIGYDYVELGNTPENPREFKALLDKYGLGVISGHMGIENLYDHPDDTIEACKILGIKYFVLAYLDIWNLKGHDGETETIEKVAAAAKLLKKNGISLIHHNHTYEFHRHEGKSCLDWLLDDITPELLHLQIDTGWVRFCGYDPAEMLRKYKGLIEIVHLKDFKSDKYSKNDKFIPLDAEKLPRDTDDADQDKSFDFTPIGYGVQNFEGIIKASIEVGAEMVVVEQDNSKTENLLDTAKKSREYLRSLGI